MVGKSFPECLFSSLNERGEKKRRQFMCSVTEARLNQTLGSFNFLSTFIS